jgi:hypothetical protein
MPMIERGERLAIALSKPVHQVAIGSRFGFRHVPFDHIAAKTE